MRIGIDGRLYSESGIGRYIRNLVFELSKLDHKNDYFLFLNKNNYHTSKYGNNFTKVLADFSWYGISEQIKFPKLLNSYKLDLVHFPHFNVPIFYSGKFIVTIHDLIHEKFEMRRATRHDPLMYKLKHFGYKKVFSHAIKKSQKIVTVSNYVKEELIKNWRVDEKKITVTPEAVEGQLIARATDCNLRKIEEVLEKFQIKPPYIFYVGNAHPHKNVEGLIAAFRQLKIKYQKSNIKNMEIQLVLAGHDHYFWERIRKSVQEIGGSGQKDIVFTGYVTDEELVALYKGAECLVMSSFEEGFGIPILEAFAMGCPVVSSNAPALKEVGGDACLYFDPHSTADMAEKIIKVLDSSPRHPDPARSGEGSNLRNELIEKGRERVKLFSWEKLAKETLKTYRDVF